jgi:hypothetical protein
MIEFSYVADVQRGSQKPIVRTYNVRMHVFGCSPGLCIVSYVGADPYTGFRKQVHGDHLQKLCIQEDQKREEERSHFFLYAANQT